MQTRVRYAAAGVMALAIVALAAGRAQAQEITLHLQSKEVYAGLPFVLAVSATGFEPEPEPEISEFAIPGCKVTFLGVSPNVSRSISIVNGRRTESMTVEFVYRYRVEAKTAGTYQVPTVTVTQGSQKATSRPARFRADDIETTRDMAIQLGLPERPVWVGETFTVTMDWLLRRDPLQPSFSIPLFDDPAWLDVHAPTVPDRGQSRQVVTFLIGDRDLDLPYVRDTVTVSGLQYTRLRFALPVTPIKAGTLEVPPTQVVAALEVGMRRDRFGFPSPQTKFFKAVDKARNLEIRPLPRKDRPPSFANAVGTAFSIKVQASRTVVQVGDPIELQILVRGDGRLEGLSLPDLENPQGLPAALFAVADTPATGEMMDGGKSKLFRVTVRLKSAEAREIPKIGWSYFDPQRGLYKTVYSEPIALSVEGSATVGASDVVSAVAPSATPAGPGGSAGSGVRVGAGTNAGTGAAGTSATVGALVGADLSLSSAQNTLAAVWSVDRVKPFLYALYILPLLGFGLRVWQVSTRDRRGQSNDVRRSLRAIRTELDRAGSSPAREAAPRVLAALRTLAKTTEQRATGDVIERLETESFNPQAASQPLAPELRAEVLALAESWAQTKVNKAASKSAGAGASAAFLVAAAGALASPPAAAQTATDLSTARAAYQEALAETDRDARTGAFARAEALFRAQVAAYPDRPELLTDWGNAALGAQKLGQATLAYRRALAVDPSQARAERNLSWVRNRLPAWVPRPAVERASDSLFFWHHALSAPVRHLIGGVAFAVLLLLLAPWGKQRRLWRRLAILPAAVWVAMTASILLQSSPVAEAVIMNDSVPLLSADSNGAPPALANPLPAGTEVTIIEVRDLWTRVNLADGTKGWLQTSAVVRVRPLQ